MSLWIRTLTRPSWSSNLARRRLGTSSVRVVLFFTSSHDKYEYVHSLDLYNLCVSSCIGVDSNHILPVNVVVIVVVVVSTKRQAGRSLCGNGKGATSD